MKTPAMTTGVSVPNRDGGGQHFFDRSLSSKLTKASVHGGDEVRKLSSPDCMMSQVTPNDFRGEWPMTVFGFHGSPPSTIFYFAL